MKMDWRIFIGFWIGVLYVLIWLYFNPPFVQTPFGDWVPVSELHYDQAHPQPGEREND